MYLVVLQYPMDDLPVRLFSEKEKALEFIEHLNVEAETIQSTHILNTAEPSLPCMFVSLIEFSDGYLGDREIVKSF